MVWLQSQRVRDLAFLVVGATTPVGILAVNLSAFIMQHLAQFRVGIALCALISGLSLNGLTAAMVLGRFERRFPELVREYRIWIAGATILFVAGFSVFGAYGTYESMQDPRRLPNVYAVLTALWLLFWPFALTLISRRFNRGPASRRGVVPPSSPPPSRPAPIETPPMAAEPSPEPLREP
jgi:hypothetical protein